MAYYPIREKNQKIQVFPDFQALDSLNSLLSHPGWESFLSYGGSSVTADFFNLIQEASDRSRLYEAIFGRGENRLVTAVVSRLPEELLNEALDYLQGAQIKRESLELSGVPTTRYSYIPRLVTAFAEIKHLSLRYLKKIPSQILDEISAQVSLRSLSLSNTTMADKHPLKGIAQFRSLVHLDLSNCDWLSNKDLESISKCSLLSHLNLRACRNISSAGLLAIENRALKGLYLDAAIQLDERCLAALEKLDSLEELSLKGLYRLGSGELSSLAKLTNLQKLNLSGVKPEGPIEEILEALSQLQQLEDLDLSYWPRWTVSAAQSLAKLTRLRRLRCAYSNSFDDACLHTLGARLNLETLDLSATPIDGSGFEGGNWTLLRHLLLNQTSLSDAELQNFADCSDLEILSLRDCTEMNGEGLAFLSKCTKLKSLDLTGCVEIGPEALYTLPFLTNLEALTLSSCPLQTGENLEFVAALKQLRYLNLSFCSQLEGHYLPRLLGDHSLKGPPLEELNLIGCTMIKPADLMALSRITTLTRLEIGPSHHLKAQDVEEFESLLPNCAVTVLELEGERGNKEEGKQ